MPGEIYIKQKWWALMLSVWRVAHGNLSWDHRHMAAGRRLIWNGQKANNTHGDIRDRWARARAIQRLMSFIWRERMSEKLRAGDSQVLISVRCTQRWSDTDKVKIERERYLTFEWQWDNKVKKSETQGVREKNEKTCAKS